MENYPEGEGGRADSAEDVGCKPTKFMLPETHPSVRSISSTNVTRKNPEDYPARLIPAVFPTAAQPSPSSSHPHPSEEPLPRHGPGEQQPASRTLRGKTSFTGWEEGGSELVPKLPFSVNVQEQSGKGRDWSENSSELESSMLKSPIGRVRTGSEAATIADEKGREKGGRKKGAKKDRPKGWSDEETGPAASALVSIGGPAQTRSCRAKRRKRV
ncbi:hypothetical protein KM043_009488 [Ampulex compressa]|nr:hypothetical protein KM043_009488 [Ampulex compressa]